MTTSAATAQSPKQMGKVFGLAVVIGILAAIGASVFLQIVHAGHAWLFESLPETFGWHAVPAWWYVVMLAVGAAITIGAQRLPGATAKGPLTGFHFDTPPAWAPSILLAALGSLVFGFVLGPEAPLIILGTTIGSLIVGKKNAKIRAMGAFLGGAAAIGAVFGNPFVTGFMILEFAALGLAPAALLMPAFVALAAGYLMQMGIGTWNGFGLHSLSVPDMPQYLTLHLGDILAATIVALIAAVIAALVREIAIRFELLARGRMWLMPILGFIVVAACVVVAGLAFDIPGDMILMSGQGAPMATLIGETAAGTVLAIVIIKGIAYAASLGGGLRGGPIFPATFLGVGVGVLAMLLVPSLSVSAMAAAGIAATSTAMTRLPFTSGLLAMLLIASAGANIAPFAIVGAVVGMFVRLALDRMTAKQAAPI